MNRGKHMIRLEPLQTDDKNRFILDNQRAFRYGALEEFGCRNEEFEADGEIISRETIVTAIEAGTAYRILQGERKVGGLVIRVEGKHGELELLFVSPEYHSKGIGYSAWCEVERLYPQVRVWETVTPYFEKRNIHFYVNRCGFKIVEFFHPYHLDQNNPERKSEEDLHEPDEMFRFEKVLE